VDGVSRAKIGALIADLRAERFRWRPVRRVEIPKRDGKTRPLGIPTWRDKLLQEVVRSLLDAYHEPQFSDSSHGFRPGRGCHTAPTAIADTWAGTKWFIEGDIRGCFSIVAAYQAEYRGYVEYYALAQNIGWLNKLRWVMEASLLKTLAGKHRTSVAKMSRRYRAVVPAEVGPRPCLGVRVERQGKAPLLARFGGLPLRRRRTAILTDRVLASRRLAGVELLQRLRAERCELCGSAEEVQVHHVRKLADLKVKGRGEPPAWKRLMASRRRKTLVLCRECHAAVHQGRPTRRPERG
jgi:hypothetical protein